MKKLFYLFLIIGLVVTSCNKPIEIPTTEKEVVFSASMGATNFKSSNGDTPSTDCNTSEASYAMIGINGEDPFRVELTINEDGNIITESIKLSDLDLDGNDDGTDYQLTFFALFDSNDDIILGTPLSDAPFGSFVTAGLPVTFTVDGFFKNEVPVQVLCYTPTLIAEFGYSWFAFDVINVREICFFGDICVDASDYAGSLYKDQKNGLQHDMPAIFRVDISMWNEDANDGVGAYEIITTKNNETFEGSSTDAFDWLGEGAALCVQYPDYSGTDKIKIDLSVYVKVDGGFAYVNYKTWEFLDNNFLVLVTDQEEDGVIDFVIGDCVPGADIIIPWDDDPTTPDPDPVDRTIKFNGNICLDDGTTPAQFEIIFTDNTSTIPYYSGAAGGEISITYTDYPNQNDNFQFVLSVNVNGTWVGTTLSITDDGGLFDEDNEPINFNDNDGVVDFIVGDCEPNADIIIQTPEPCGTCGYETDAQGEKIQSLTLQYTGGITDLENLHIIVTADHENPPILYNGKPGNNPFTFIGQKGGGEVGAKIYVYINTDLEDLPSNPDNLPVGDIRRIHSSCSVPFYVGQYWGDFEVVSGILQSGSTLCSESN